MKSVQNDMTVGSPMKMILSFTFPIFLGNVFQQFYNMADAVIVGKFVGTKALAAVGSTGTIMFLICSWNDSRIYCSHSTEVWCGRYEGDAAHRCGGRNPFVVDRSVPYGYLYVIYETTFASDEYSVRYFCRCI